MGINNGSSVTITKPKDAARIFFRYVKKQIIEEVQKLGFSEIIQYAVSIPASFEANQRRELIEALEANGMQLNRQALIDEPNAAFLSYVRQSEADSNPLLIPDTHNDNVLVFDFGAGTCDVSILEIGQKINGLYSKNLAISEFKKLGGDDIDRYIALHYLLPQLLEENGLEANIFRTRDLSEGIIPALLKSAEQLKIGICKVVGLMCSNQELPLSASSDKQFKLGVTLQIDTRKGVLSLHEPCLTYRQFGEAMAVFLKPRNTAITQSKKGGDPFISIFNPISSALRKAHLGTNDISYVLFIGGSAQNPYVQDALRSYFDESELLVPRDLQTHVSQGAALHSLMYNGFKTNVIQPITSEPIILITKDERPRILIPAGEPVPTQPITIDDLVTDSVLQKSIELPICVGNVNKMLFNIRITHPDEGFAPNTIVRLSLELNSDKLLLIQAKADERAILVEPMSPFANRELTTEERAIIIAERHANSMAARNGGKPPKDALLALANAYEKANKDLLAAETLEQLVDLYPDSSKYNQIGRSYSQAGQMKKATEYYELAHNNSPENQTLVFNLAYSLRQSDPVRYRELIEKAYRMNPNDPVTMIEWGDIKKEQGDEEYKTLYQKAFDAYNKRYELNTLHDFEYSWFAHVAEKLGKHGLAHEIRASNTKQKGDSFFDPNNLIRTQQTQNLLDQ